jgi:hypothetical protein
MHLAQQISVAVQGVVSGLAATGSRVHDGRPRQLGSGDLPALVIQIGEDPAVPITKLYPRLMAHTLQVTVWAFVKATTTPADLHEVRLQVEKAMSAAAPSLGGLTTDIRCVGAGQREQDSEADTPVGMLPINFEIDYRHQENAPDVAQ